MKRHILKGTGVLALGIIGAMALSLILRSPAPPPHQLVDKTIHHPTVTPLATPSPSPACSVTIVNSSDPQAVLPDSSCTPGSLNPGVTQENIYATICTTNYTELIRPPLSYTSALKKEQMIKYGFTNGANNYEEDHLIPLELGGGAKNPLNLWPELGKAPNSKDKVEKYLHTQVCSGNMTLLEAQREVSTNWYRVFTQATL